VFIFDRYLIAARALSLPQLPAEIFDDICNTNSYNNRTDHRHN